MAETAKPKKVKFKAEVSQLLDILTHSLYTHRDVFIRELISNAADALDKVRFMEVKGEEVVDSKLDLAIKIELDKEGKTFTITDTGIGMTHDELVKNIGTIARSGTSEFIKQLGTDSDDKLNLIGKFGVGFYSVFMAGQEVEIITKSAVKGEMPCRWVSDGRGSFEVEEIHEQVNRGTQIKVSLRDDATEFAEEYRVKSTIEKYSSFVSFPIFVGEEQVNKIQAIWREPKSNVKKDEYNEFFKFIAHQGDEPLTHLHFSADVPLQFHSLLFVPKTNMELMGFGREDDGINLFVKRVLIDSHSKDVLPTYLRFVRGVLESDDLPLNISRETLQENPYMMKIKSSVVKKFLGHLQEFSEKEPDEYKKFWKEHGRIIKEGYNDFQHKDQVADLFLFNSSKCENIDEMINLKTYVERMPEKQEEIIFLSGSSREALDSNPTTEIFKTKDIEVLYCFDPIDEFVLPGLFKYKEKDIKSADQVDLKKLEEIPSQSDEKDEDSVTAPDKKDLEKLARRMKDILGTKVDTVRLSERLVDSPAVLVSTSDAMSGQMEKIMQMMNKDSKPSAKVMEINGKHPVVKNMLTIYQKDAKDVLLDKLTLGLFSSVMLLDGSVDEPQTMAASIQDLLQEATKMYLADKSNSDA